MPQIWSGQEVLGLILGVTFAAMLNLAMVARFIWTESFASGWPEFLSALVVCHWLTSLGYTLWWIWLCHPERHRAEIDRLFREATEFYLQGHWNEARRRYERILSMDETDADALMQLGTLYVRVEQPALARRAFRQCLDLEGGVKWRWEIRQALTRIGDVSSS
jgi:tetratricopeptide (TPR) repeat protein